ncbi:unnamed protein product [Amoebophrya sp. A120]|nr:unnamed protein product [Amoebophrya sp. A120]|eukprot:GSA120T00006984001.1
MGGRTMDPRSKAPASAKRLLATIALLGAAIEQTTIFVSAISVTAVGQAKKKQRHVEVVRENDQKNDNVAASRTPPTEQDELLQLDDHRTTTEELPTSFCVDSETVDEMNARMAEMKNKTAAAWSAFKEKWANYIYDPAVDKLTESKEKFHAKVQELEKMAESTLGEMREEANEFAAAVLLPAMDDLGLTDEMKQMYDIAGEMAGFAEASLLLVKEFGLNAVKLPGAFFEYRKLQCRLYENTLPSANITNAGVEETVETLTLDRKKDLYRSIAYADACYKGSEEEFRKKLQENAEAGSKLALSKDRWAFGEGFDATKAEWIDILKARYEADVKMPAYVLFGDKQRKAVVLAIRGTKAIDDAITDLRYKTVSEEMASYFDEGSLQTKEQLDGHNAHPAIYLAAKDTAAETEQAITDFFADAAHAGTYKDLIITGHSLGAATASWVYSLWTEQAEKASGQHQFGADVTIWGYPHALPSVVDSLPTFPFATFLGTVANDDAVPRLNTPGRVVTVLAEQIALLMRYKQQNPPPSDDSSSALQAYQDEMWKHIQEEQADIDFFHATTWRPAGQAVLYLPNSEEKEKRDCHGDHALTGRAAHYSLTSPVAFDELILSFQMLPAHKTSNYLAKVLRVLELEEKETERDLLSPNPNPNPNPSVSSPNQKNSNPNGGGLMEAAAEVGKNVFDTATNLIGGFMRTDDVQAPGKDVQPPAAASGAVVDYSSADVAGGGPSDVVANGGGGSLVV